MRRFKSLNTLTFNDFGKHVQWQTAGKAALLFLFYQLLKQTFKALSVCGGNYFLFTLLYFPVIWR